MKKFTHYIIRKISTTLFPAILVLLLAASGNSFGQIYQHNFGTTTISSYPYTVAPSILDANISNSSWTNSTGAWTSYGGSSGQAIALSNSSGTPTITLTFKVAAGYSLSLSSFSFWCQRSTAGAQGWSMKVNGIAVGSGVVPTTGANTGTVTPTNTISGITGTVTVVLSLSGASGTGTFRLDDFTLNGSVTSAASCTISTFPWSENFDGLTTLGTSYFPACWLNESGDWTSGNAGSQSYNDPRSSPNYIYDDFMASNDYIWTPGFALTASTTYTFTFWFVGDGSSGWTGDVLYNTVQSSTGGTLTQLAPSFITSGTTSSASYTQVTRTITPAVSGTYYFAIRVSSNINPWYLGFDDFSLTCPASCSAPATQAINVSFSSTCFANSTISWTRGNGDGCAVFIYQGNSGTAAPTDGTSYAANTSFGSGDQAGAGWYCIYNGTGTSVNVSGLVASTDYIVHVCEYNCSGTNIKYNSTSSTNNPNTTTTSSTACGYCTPGATTCDEYISNVHVGTINNSSACTSGGYKDYTALSTNMTIGTGYTITVTNGNGYIDDQCGIWVDWNHDGDFADANETITVNGTPGVGPYTATISPPLGAATGTTRMRIRITYTGTLDPCDTVQYGETEDYTINVNGGACTPPGTPSIVSTTGITATGATFTWAAGAPAGSSIVSYYWAVGTAPGVTYNAGYVDRGITTNLSDTTLALTCATGYYWAVQAYTSCNASTSAYATSGLFNTSACPPVPSNDQCAGAIAVTCGSSTPGTTVGATTTNDPSTACGVTITSPGVWYSFIGTGQDITISFCGSALPTSLSVYSGACGALTCIGGNEGNYASCGDNNAYYTFTSSNATQYYFFVHGIGTATGTFTMNVSCASVSLPGCPTPTTPGNAAINVGTAASLNWTAPGGAVSYYKLYFGTDAAATNINNGTNIGNVLTYSPTMAINTTYYWKVTAVNSSGESTGCAIWHFKTVATSNLIVDNTSFTPSQLVQNYLISGCLVAQNIKYTGNSKQIGYFIGGTNTVGYYSGLVLSTGNAIQAEGPNSSPKTSTDYSGAGDATIASMIGVTTSKTHDASILEFDFIPSSNNVSFSYTFASEEYNEYVNTAYNDAFGFFLSGGPQNYTNKNIALIPGTSTPVAINNVNNGFAAAGSMGPGPGKNASYYRDNADGHMNIQCDGLTTVLTATATVTACQTYHIKLSIADVNDGIYDSWVFLQANSFSSGDAIAMDLTNPTGTKVSYKGCTSLLTFTRVDSSNTVSPVTINYTVGGTAVAGSDYVALPNPVVIPSGDTSVTIPISTIIGAPTGQRTIAFAVPGGGCPCNMVTLKDTIYLRDYIAVTANIKQPDTAICTGTSLILNGLVTGNLIQYSWHTGSTSGPIISHSQNYTTPALISTTNYYLTVKDSCGHSAEDSIHITINPVSSITSVTGATPLCIGGTTTYTANGAVLGVGTGAWSSSNNAFATVDATGLVTGVSAGSCNIKYTITGGCPTPISAQQLVTVTPNNTITLTSAAGTDGQTVCVNTAITNIKYSTTGATGATFAGLPTGVIGNWAGSVVTISGSPSVTAGSPYTYTITLTGGCGNITKTGTITVIPNNTITLTSAAGTDGQTVCVNTAITNITYSTTGATGATGVKGATGATGDTGDTRLKCDVSTLPAGAIGMISRSIVSPSPVMEKRLFRTWAPLVSNSTSLGPLNHIETFDFRPASLTTHSLPTVLHSNSVSICAPLELVTWMESAEPSSNPHVDLASPSPSICCHLPISLARLESSSAKAVLARSSVLKAIIGTFIGPPLFGWRFGSGAASKSATNH